MIDRERLKAEALKYDIKLSEKMLEQLDIYAERLVKVNEQCNLTAITDPREIEIKHFLDSMLCVPMIEKDAGVIDVGTGAGFPGIVLKIIRPDIKLTLLDSLLKRILFLQDLCDEIGIEAEFVHERAEVLSRLSDYREHYRHAVSRAVAQLNVLSEFCLPFVEIGGSFIALKSKNAGEEIESAGNAISLLGGEAPEVYNYLLPDGSERSICKSRKTAATPEKYPRRSPQIAKKPL